MVCKLGFILYIISLVIVKPGAMRIDNFNRTAKILVPPRGLPDQHYLRLGGQAGLPDL